MTNHMIIMVCESDVLYVRFYLYHAKSLLLYLIQSPFGIQPQAIVFIIMCCYPCHTMQKCYCSRGQVYIYFLSIASIQIPHTNSSKLQTKSRSFIDYNDQSNNSKCTVYLYDSFLHMSCDFLSIIDVIVFFSYKTLIRCHFHFSIVEFNCDNYSTFLCIPIQCLCLVELDIVTTLSEI